MIMMKLCQVHRKVPEQMTLTCNEDIKSQNVHDKNYRRVFTGLQSRLINAAQQW